jgi:carbon-monoxide dehydrogenase large subunit
MLSGPYRIPAIKCEVVGVLTNTAPVDAYRGAGRPEATHLLERMVDVLARRLGIDPAEVRRRNFLKKEEFPYQSVTGILYDSGDYQTAFNKALEKIGYIEFRRK